MTNNSIDMDENVIIFKENEKDMKGELIKIIGNELHRIAEDKKLAVDYITICACALELIDVVLEKEYDFPIDIEKIAESLDIDVICQPLNGKMGRQDGCAHRVVGRNLKRVNRVTNETRSCILIDDESRYDEQRYALAHELTHYLKHIEERRFNSEYYVMPMLFKKMEEMVADIFAIFLLIPLPIFIKEFATYMGNQSKPVKTSEWLKYLSLVAEVPYENVAIGYQNIRYVCGIIYGVIKGELIVKNDDEKADVILQKQLYNMKSVLTEEVIERLFC